MLKRVIDGWNAAPGAPASWNPEKDGQCGALPIRVHPPEALQAGPNRAAVQWVESAWEPTPREMTAIMLGRSIILRIIGWQPPVALYVDEQPAPGALLVDDPARWFICYADQGFETEWFRGADAETVARERFAERSPFLRCSLYREVATA